MIPTLEIIFSNDATAFAPGLQLTGTIHWNLRQPEEVLALSLLWFTSGKGTRDVGLIEQQIIRNPSPQGEQEFRFQLPREPYSFSGKLMSITWAVELIAQNNDTSTRAEFVLAPMGQEIRAGRAK